MPSSGMLHRVAPVGTDVSEERSTSETSIPTRATRCNFPEDGILYIEGNLENMLTSVYTRLN
jgi:hypothetical protein